MSSCFAATFNFGPRCFQHQARIRMIASLCLFQAFVGLLYKAHASASLVVVFVVKEERRRYTQKPTCKSDSQESLCLFSSF
mmetsp:Transcript_44473/g.72063  ORF Transcript_44473/g.72063 Transcript_44473/m.72063 type:complete len:81 (+) Transcript_44473:57-299(+)